MIVYVVGLEDGMGIYGVVGVFSDRCEAERVREIIFERTHYYVADIFEEEIDPEIIELEDGVHVYRVGLYDDGRCLVDESPLTVRGDQLWRLVPVTRERQEVLVLAHSKEKAKQLALGIATEAGLG